MTVYRDADEARAEIVAFLERFLASEDGEASAAQAAVLDAPAVLELRLHDPEVVLHLDVAARTVGIGPAKDPGAVADVELDDLHHLLMDHLGPVEISRLAEEDRLTLEGPPPVLTAVLLLAARIQPHYAASLRERGREDLLAIPGPPIHQMWQSAEPPPPVIGKRRPWQRPRGAAVTAG